MVVSQEKRLKGSPVQPLSSSMLLKWQTQRTYFFLCLFLRKRFLRLCVDILCLFLFFPLGIIKR